MPAEEWEQLAVKKRFDIFKIWDFFKTWDFEKYTSENIPFIVLFQYK